MLERVIDRLRGRTPLPPGFVSGERKNTYKVDPALIDADRVFQEMPVDPKYAVQTEVELLGAPTVLVDENVAANPRNDKLPNLEQLLDGGYYAKEVFPKLMSQAQITARGIVTGPVESRPSASNVFIFPVIRVQHIEAVQALGSLRDRLTLVGSGVPHAIKDGELVVDEVAKDLEGLAFVTHVRVPLDLRQFFSKPADLRRADGGLSVRDVMGKSMIQDVFKDKLEAIGEKVSEVRKKPVKGVLLSPITVNWRIMDRIMTIGHDSAGELIIAASYLV